MHQIQIFRELLHKNALKGNFKENKIFYMDKHREISNLKDTCDSKQVNIT